MSGVVQSAVEAARWTTASMLNPAGTITVVANSRAADVIVAFGGGDSQMGATVPLSATRDDLDPHVCVGQLGGHTFAVEVAGWQGSRPAVLGAASYRTRAASVSWGTTFGDTLSLAEGGRSLGSTELGRAEFAGGSAFGRLLNGVDLTDPRRLREHALVAAARFTGVTVTADALAGLLAADRAYPILPLPAEYHQSVSSWSDEVRPLADAADQLPPARLRDASWQFVARAATASGTMVDPDVAATVHEHALTADAIRQARLAELGRYRSTGRIWRVLYAAANPDPRSALIQAAEEAEFLLSPETHRKLIRVTVTALGAA
ncbi:hypothetical protein [Skermania piniformis]|uniref:Uncharacterized protein n=1 Tax=Skermania pinensis TaxID=39122 RepID=A0ABX8S493_9ACTN|nr:hypothetical protein [Skermania piniformis]QXQ12653.1 hypothetical protein KV203_11875 [Skermania piniformis]